MQSIFDICFTTSLLGSSAVKGREKSRPCRLAFRLAFIHTAVDIGNLP